MKRNEKTHLRAGIGFLAAFGLWTALSVLAVAVFIAARQPYAGILCFALLVIKAFGIMKWR